MVSIFCSTWAVADGILDETVDAAKVFFIDRNRREEEIEVWLLIIENVSLAYFVQTQHNSNYFF